MNCASLDELQQRIANQQDVTMPIASDLGRATYHAIKKLFACNQAGNMWIFQEQAPPSGREAIAILAGLYLIMDLVIQVCGVIRNRPQQDRILRCKWSDVEVQLEWKTPPKNKDT